jgi:Carboxypeptidase regulatory-like domain
MFNLTAVTVVSVTVLSAGAVSLFSTASSNIPQSLESQDGAIAGRVLDADGHPIPGVMVLAEITTGMIRPTPRAWTNKDGDYLIQSLPPGRYKLYSRKDEDGYPHTAFLLYYVGDDIEPTVEVGARQTTPNVILQRGLKAAVLEGIIVDATTNQPLKGAQLTVRRVDRPERFLSTGLFWHVDNDPLKFVEGGFKFLVPSLAFTLQVTAPGYKDWYYKMPGERNQASAILLAPGSTKKLSIALSRSGQRSG